MRFFIRPPFHQSSRPPDLSTVGPRIQFQSVLKTDVPKAQGRFTDVHPILSTPVAGSVPSDPDFISRWNQVIGVHPEKLYEALAKNLPFDVKMSISSLTDKEAKLDLDGTLGDKILFRAVYLLSSDNKTKNAEIFFISTKMHPDFDLRGFGIGKIAFDNLLTFASEQRYSHIHLFSGYENGNYFWAKRFGVLRFLDDEHFGYFENEIRTSLNALPQSSFDSDFYRKVDKILKQRSPYANCQLANLNYMYEGLPIGQSLIQEAGAHLIFRLKDRRQMKKVRGSLRDVEDLRRSFVERLPYGLGNHVPA